MRLMALKLEASIKSFNVDSSDPTNLLIRKNILCKEPCTKDFPVGMGLTAKILHGRMLHLEHLHFPPFLLMNHGRGRGLTTELKSIKKLLRLKISSHQQQQSSPHLHLQQSTTASTVLFKTFPTPFQPPLKNNHARLHSSPHHRCRRHHGPGNPNRRCSSTRRSRSTQHRRTRRAHHIQRCRAIHQELLHLLLQARLRGCSTQHPALNPILHPVLHRGHEQWALPPQPHPRTRQVVRPNELVCSFVGILP